MVEPYGRNIGISKEKGIIYIGQVVCKGDTVAGEIISAGYGGHVGFGAYDTLGNKLFFKYSKGSGTCYTSGISVLSNNRVAIGGRCYGYQSFGEVDNDSVCGAFFYLFDGNSGHFILSETVPCSINNAEFTVFHMDNDDNLLFGGRIFRAARAIFGDDTIQGRSNKYNSFFGKYGWACGSQADWPKPISIPTAPLTEHLKVYPNPSSNGIWIEHSPASNDNCQLRLRNVLGQTVLEKTLDATIVKEYLSLKSLPKGIYVIDYRKNGQTIGVQKLIKQ